MTTQYPTVLLFGAPGSGKGTQGKILGTIPGYFHCACGDVFRSLTIESELGRKFIEFSSRGELVPDQPTVQLWREFINANTSAGRFRPETDVLVLDGLPRNPSQAQLLQNTLDVRALINLDCPDKNKLIERLQRRALKENRLDDANLDIIRRRLETYENETAQVLDFYGPKLTHVIDSTQPVTHVLHAILSVLRTIVPGGSY